MGYKLSGFLLQSYGINTYPRTVKMGGYNVGNHSNNVKGFYVMVGNINYTNPDRQSQVWCLCAIPTDENSVSIERTQYLNGQDVATITTESITPGQSTDTANRYIIFSGSGNLAWATNGQYQEQLQGGNANWSYWKSIGLPIFERKSNSTEILNYINNGDTSGALNADELKEKLYANWTIGYTQSTDTVYSIACDAPQFADSDSEFYGKGEIAKINIKAKYIYDSGGEYPLLNLNIAYGQTYSGKLSDIIKQADFNVANEIAAKILDIGNLMNLRFEFALMYGIGDDTVSTPYGYVEFDHASVESYGFLTEITDDTISFKRGEVLDDEDSNISNAEISDDIESEYEEQDESEISVDGGNLLTKTYALDVSKTQGIGQYLWGATFIQDIKLVNNNPIENIIACKAFPFLITNVTENESHIYIGNCELETNAKCTNSRHKRLSFNVEITIDKFDTNLKFLNYAPYTQVYLILPFVGEVEIPCDILRKDNESKAYVQVYYDVDLISGSTLVTLCACKNSNVVNAPFFNKEIQLGIDIPLTASNLNQILMSYMTNAIDGVFNIASGNVAGVVGNVTNAIQTQYHSDIKGSPSPSNALYSNLNIYVKIIYPKIWDIGTATKDGVEIKRKKYLEIFGGVLNEIHTLGSLSGFTKVSNGNIKVKGATLSEVTEINRLLEEGVYL